MRFMISAFVVLLVVTASARQGATGKAAAPPTFAETIAPIVFSNCVSCHRAGEAAPFTLTSYDDVAKRADVAKGTIYLYFADKEALFQELIRAELSPVVGVLIAASHADIPIRQFADRLIEVFAREVFETRRKDVIRLVLTEGARFPKLAEFYYQEVISRVLVAIRSLMKRAIERGELKHDALLKYPQLLPAPALVAIMWNGLFDRFEPLDVRALMRAHFNILFDDRSAT